MSVEIDPQELAFQRPFTTEVSQVLKIKNANHTPVAFKVKTTAPKQYCVRPNSGRIEPGKEVEVVVLLQAMKVEPPLDAKCRDKFLVQSVAVTSDKEFTNINEIWQHVDQAEKSSVQEKKIRVVYLPPGGANAAVTPLKNGTNGLTNGATPDTAPPAYTSQRSPSPEEASYTPDTRRSVAGGASSVRLEDEPSNARSLGDAKASSSNPAMPSTAPPAVPMSYDELKAKLAEAQATIASYAQEGGVRMRKVAKGETSNETVNQIAHRVQTNQGVPLQVVAALCLVSFLLAYLFF
ncbi:VAMP-associated protein [Hyaloscypha hepaticicola]|uniref:VAMP-associated protein n=1 Tax=Hyaloscypha hepaticicola TaxID=2082293 RepID=A0A2J6QLN6_9HELO|nr:VAMP-associated protein [Hyaloscypha hepaticicola]